MIYHHIRRLLDLIDTHRQEDIWVCLWYVRSWSSEKDSALKAFTMALGYKA